MWRDTDALFVWKIFVVVVEVEVLSIEQVLRRGSLVFLLVEVNGRCLNLLQRPPLLGWSSRGNAGGHCLATCSDISSLFYISTLGTMVF